MKKGDLFREEFRKDFVKKDKITPSPTTIEKNRLKLCSESAAIKKFKYRTCCLICSAPLWDQETDADGRCVIIPDCKRINEISFVNSKMWFDKSIHRQLKKRQDDWNHDVGGRVETVSCLQVEEEVYQRRCLELFSLQRKLSSDDTCKVVYAKRKTRHESREQGREWSVPRRIRRWIHNSKTTSRKDEGICKWTLCHKIVKKSD